MESKTEESFWWFLISRMAVAGWAVAILVLAVMGIVYVIDSAQ